MNATYEVKVKLPASLGIERTHTVRITVDAALPKKQAEAQVIFEAFMELDREGITSWSFDKVVPVTN